MFVDTHTHLYSAEFDLDRDEAIARAIEKNVTKFYLPNIDSQSIESMLAIEKQYPKNCFAMMGLHPCSVNQNYEAELTVVKQWLNKKKFIAIGEIGMDLYWDKTFINEQQTAFKQQIDWAIEFNYPIVIHCRNAFDEILAILASYSNLPKAIFHCFSGTLQQAQQIINLGNFKLGIGGVVTFKNSGLDKIVEHLDLQHFVLETDAPYLAPMPHRGKRNQSEYINIIAQKIADIKQISVSDVALITTQNAAYIFEN